MHLKTIKETTPVKDPPVTSLGYTYSSCPQPSKAHPFPQVDFRPVHNPIYVPCPPRAVSPLIHGITGIEELTHYSVPLHKCLVCQWHLPQCQGLLVLQSIAKPPPHWEQTGHQVTLAARLQGGTVLHCT